MIKDIQQKNEENYINKDRIIKLKGIFPECFTKDGDLDIELLKKALNKNISYSKESFELNFLGKSYAKMVTGLDTETVIKPDIIHNILPENSNSNNVYISGDNLDGLKHLLKAYENEVKCIYIDPPYNTNSDGFVYNDKFKFTKKDLMDKLDIQEEEAERILNMTSSNASSHSAWLTFMYERLYLARQLLADDGAIFISIDDNEQSNLKLLCDGIFGEENYVGMFSVENNTKGRRNGRYIAGSNDYCLIYVKNKENEHSYFLKNIPKAESDMNLDENGNFVHGSGKRVLVGEGDFNDEVTDLLNDNKHYTVYYNKDNNDLILKKEHNLNEIDDELIQAGYIRYCSYNGTKFIKNTYTENRFLELYEEDCLDFKDNKIYEKNMSTVKRIKSMLVNMKYDAIIDNNIVHNFEYDFKTKSAKDHLRYIFDTDKDLFSAPKSIDLVSLIISLIDSKDGIFMDFFSGSGTTAEAIERLNAKDNGTRKYILIQLPEDLKENLKRATPEGKKIIKNQIDYLQKINKPLFLDEIGQERIKKSAEKIKQETKSDIDYGFKHYTLIDTSDELLNKLETFKPELINETYELYKEYGIDTILETWKLKDGYQFTEKIEKIDLDGYTAYKCHDCIYFIIPEIKINNIQAFLERYHIDNDFSCNKIILFGYSFTFNEVEMIKNNLNNFKDLKIKIYERY